MIVSQLLGLDVVQGTFETRSEAYIRYVERALEALTQQYAKRAGRVSGSARKQVGPAQ